MVCGVAVVAERAHRSLLLLRREAQYFAVGTGTGCAVLGRLSSTAGDDAIRRGGGMGSARLDLPQALLLLWWRREEEQEEGR